MQLVCLRKMPRREQPLVYYARIPEFIAVLFCTVCTNFTSYYFRPELSCELSLSNQTMRVESWAPRESLNFDITDKKTK